MTHTVSVSLRCLWDQLRTQFVCPSFAFGTNDTCGSVSSGPYLGGKLNPTQLNNFNNIRTMTQAVCMS